MKTNCCHSKHYLEVEEGILCLNHACINYLGKCRKVSSGKSIKNLMVLSVFGFYLLFSVDDFSMSGVKNEIRYRNALARHEVPLNHENLRQELLTSEVICPNEVMAQILLESGNLGSALLKKTNNMLGMRFPFSRPTTAIGMYIPSRDTIIYGRQEDLKKYRNTGHYAVYKDWQDAVKDYKCWQKQNFILADRYLNFLGNIYAEDTLYISKIKRMATSQNMQIAVR